MKGSTHCHSENSRYDSAMNVKMLCKAAKNAGYEAVALTDHGTCTRIDDFVAAAREEGIKPIPGVEAYIHEENSLYKPFHMILLATDDLGYQGIGKAVSESNKHIDSQDRPLMNKEILKKYFGPDSIYHGHVIATSACVGGVLAGILLSPMELDKEIAKVKRRQERYEAPNTPSYKKNLESLKFYQDMVADLAENRAKAQVLAKKPYKKKEKMVEKLKDDPEAYAEALAALEAEKAESEKAKKDVEKLKEAVSLANKSITQIKERIKASELSHEKYLSYQKEIDSIQAQKIPMEQLYDVTKNEANQYREIFGDGNFYVEVQYHGYLTEDKRAEIEVLAMPVLVKLAKELHLPLIAANDAHIPDNSKESIMARHILSSLRYAQDKDPKIRPIEKGDTELYMKNENELKQALLHVTDAKTADEAIANAYAVCDRCNCEFKNGTHYPKFQSLLPGETADGALRRITLEGIEHRFPGRVGWTDEYEKRMEYELSVIADMGYSDYFLIVLDFLGFGRKLGHLSNEHLEYLREHVKLLTLKELIDYVDAHQEEVGFAVGAGRGSAAGSLVAYLVGITNIIDPLKYDLLFERFLNKDRVSMPETSGIQCEPCSRVYL